MAADLFERAAIWIRHARATPAVAADANTAASPRKEVRGALRRQEGFRRHVLAAWQKGLSNNNVNFLGPEVIQLLANRLGLAVQAGCGEWGSLVERAEVEGNGEFSWMGAEAGFDLRCHSSAAPPQCARH